MCLEADNDAEFDRDVVELLRLMSALYRLIFKIPYGRDISKSFSVVQYQSGEAIRPIGW